MATITMTPDLPYFAAAADCDWVKARLIAERMGDEHVEAVERAEAMAAAEAATAEDLVLVRSDQGDGGWSLHAPGSTDEDIASGDALCLLTGPADDDDGDWSRPNAADYAAALRVLARRAAA